MPPLPAVPKVIRADFLHTFEEDLNVVNRLFFQYSGAMTEADLATLAATFATAWGGNVMPLLSNSLSLFASELTDLTSSTAPQVNHGDVVAGGDGTHPSLAANSAIAVGMEIARRYRGGHPRVYLGGLHSNMLNDVQTLKPAFVASVNAGILAAVAAMLSAPPAGVGTLAHVAVSFFSGFTNHTYPSGRVRPIPTLRVSPLVDAVIGYDTNPHIASQRRRTLQSR